MTVSVQSFKSNFPEFKNTDQQLVEKKLNAAINRISQGTWGSLANEGIMYLTAHFLSLAPAGEQARLKPKNRKNQYKIEFDNLVKIVAMGLGRIA